jgi:hypothetical protein
VPPSLSAATPLDRYRPWVNRVCWVALVGSLGLALGPALASHSRPVQLVGGLLAWVGWALGLAALVIAHPIGLSTLRVCLAAVVGATGWVAFQDGVPVWQRALCVVVTLVVLTVVGSAETATWCVDGPAYPNECRHALKMPTAFVPIAALLCALIAGSFIAAPLLLAARAWVPGSVAVLVAGVAGWGSTRSLHQFSRRFIVFVPAGFVVHDNMALLDPVLFRKNLVERFGPAEVGTDSLDLTLGAAGMPLDISLSEKVELSKLSPDRKTGEMGKTARFLVSPLRPGAVMREAAARNYPVH